jgi:hypothetical protein
MSNPTTNNTFNPPPLNHSSNHNNNSNSNTSNSSMNGNNTSFSAPRSKSSDSAFGHSNTGGTNGYLNQPRAPPLPARVSSDPTPVMTTTTTTTARAPDLRFAGGGMGISNNNNNNNTNNSGSSSSRRSSTLTFANLTTNNTSESARRISLVGSQIPSTNMMEDQMLRVGAFQSHQSEFFKFADLTESIETQQSSTSSPSISNTTATTTTTATFSPLQKWKEVNGIVVNPSTLSFQSQDVEDEYERFKFRGVERSAQFVCGMMVWWAVMALFWDYKRTILQEETQMVGPVAYGIRQGYFTFVLLLYSSLLFGIRTYPGQLFTRASDRTMGALISITTLLTTCIYPEALRVYFQVPGIPTHLDLLPFRTMTMTLTWLMHALGALSFGLRFKTTFICCFIALLLVTINLFVPHMGGGIRQLSSSTTTTETTTTLPTTDTTIQTLYPLVPFLWGLIGVCWTSYVWDQRERSKFISLALSFEAKSRVQAAGASLSTGASISKVESALSALQLIKNDFAIGQNHAMTSILEACITALAEGTSKKRLTVNDIMFNNAPPSPTTISPGSSRHTSSLEDDNNNNYNNGGTSLASATTIPIVGVTGGGGGQGSNLADSSAGSSSARTFSGGLLLESPRGGGGSQSIFVLPAGGNRHRRLSVGESSKATMQSFIQSELSIQPQDNVSPNWINRRRSTLSNSIISTTNATIHIPPNMSSSSLSGTAAGGGGGGATAVIGSTTPISTTNTLQQHPQLQHVIVVSPLLSTESSSNSIIINHQDDQPIVSTIRQKCIDDVEFETHLRDWNFGPGNGIWGRLSENETFRAHPLPIAVMTALHSLGMFGESLSLDFDTTAKYFLAVERTYLPPDKVPYHNALHATDVVQCCYSIIRQESTLDGFPELAIFALLFGAAIHDLAHPGLNNAHLVTTRHPLAVTYNDMSPLENYHVSKAFKLMIDDPSIDLLQGMKRSAPSEAKQFRSMVVDMVLATDLKNHFDQRARFRALLARHNGPLDFHEPEETSMVCQTLLNAADISNVAKNFDAYQPWISRLFEEFYNQGRIERILGLDVAAHMDPEKSLPYDPQMLFITTFVLPLYQTLESFIPYTSTMAIINMDDNLARLEELKQHALGSSTMITSRVEEGEEGEEDEIMTEDDDDDNNTTEDQLLTSKRSNWDT